MNNTYEHIPQEKFAFAQLNATLHDEKLETKSRSYFADAMIRFRKNKSSVVAAYIIGLLLLFSLIAPILSPYSVDDKDKTYQNFPPYVESIANLNIGILDGSTTLNSQNERQVAALRAIGIETGYDPIIRILSETETTEKYRGQDIIKISRSVEVNRYYQVGIVAKNLSYEEFDKIQQFQNESGLQVLYPVVLQEDIYGKKVTNIIPASDNIWYKCADEKDNPLYDENGNFIPAYCTDASKEGRAYTSTRIAGDDGSYIYSLAKSGSVQVRVCYYNYTQYLLWVNDGDYHAPMFLFGTNELGQDLFTAIAVGARFSLIFAILVSAINLFIGAVYGAIQGYYGGLVDMILDRVTDILGNIPMMVVITLFQYHLAAKMGSLPAFLLAFIATGWIGMSALTRKQFYRFKSQEHILAARTLGASDARLMFKHIFPNALGTIVTSCALIIPGVISSETSLTYLHIIDLSSIAGTSIGTLMEQGQRAMTSSPHAMIFPALFFSLLMISFNLFGNGLRDAFNPTTKGAD